MDHDSGLRWYIQHGLWCFRVPTPYDFFLASRPYTLEGVAQRIACPVLVCAAADDHLNPGQAENLAATLGDRAHSATGKLAGLSDDVVDALLAGRPPDFRNDQEAMAHAFTRQLVGEHRVETATYARADQAFGHKGVVDMVLLIGLYLATCSLINAFEVPAPDPIQPNA